jgi:hypothetical protein
MKKHFITFYRNGELKTISPRKWARENKSHFPNFEFKNKQEDHPTTDQVVDFLKTNFSFQTVQDEIIAIHYNLNRNINLTI